jgi:hypothetical protein
LEPSQDKTVTNSGEDLTILFTPARPSKQDHSQQNRKTKSVNIEISGNVRIWGIDINGMAAGSPSDRQQQQQNGGVSTSKRRLVCGDWRRRNISQISLATRPGDRRVDPSSQQQNSKKNTGLSHSTDTAEQ